MSGEKQRTSRGYDFVEVCRWFAERSDLILLLFDAHKLDISDEFQVSIGDLHAHCSLEVHTISQGGELLSVSYKFYMSPVHCCCVVDH